MPVGLAESDFNNITFPTLAPFEEYEIKITAACTDPSGVRLGVRYELGDTIRQAIINGFMASTNCSGDPENVRDYQYLYNSSVPINMKLLNDLDGTIKSMG